MEYHPIANIFPLMPAAELEELAEDIRQHGLKEPVTLFEGKILDGRNRSAACKLAGVDPATVDFDGDRLQAVHHVWSLNRKRRHLNSSQAAVAEAKRAAMVEEYSAELEKLRKEQKRRDCGGGQGGGRSAQKVAPTASKDERATDGLRAKAAGTNRSYVATADRIVEQRPDLADEIEAGKKTIAQAKREMERDRKRKEMAKKARAAKKQNVAADFRIINDDCLNALAFLDAGTVRLIFADPPYNIGIDYGRGKSADNLPATEYLAWCKDWIGECARLLTDDGSFWLMINDEWADYLGVMLREAGLHRRAWIKWYETFGVNQGNNFNRCSRHIFYTVKDPRRCVFNADAVSRPSDRQAKYQDARADPNGKIWDDVWQIPRLVGTAKERIPDFPTQLPLQLVRAIVNCASEPGDTVLDPFNGSGTTGVAAIEGHRKYIGIEWEEKFAKLAEQRLLGVIGEMQGDGDKAPSKSRRRRVSA